MGEQRTQEIVMGLTRAYWMEIETTINYLANATNLRFRGFLLEVEKGSR